MNGNPEQAGDTNDDRLWHLPPCQSQECCQGYRSRPNIPNRVFGQDNNGSRNGTSCGSRNSLDESANPGIVRETPVRRSKQDNEQIHRQENTYASSTGSPHSIHQITNKCDGNYNRARRNHCDRDGIKKLRFGEPVVLLDHAPVKKRDDGKTAAEYE